MISYRLHKSLIQNGYKSMMIVNNKKSNDKSVIELKGLVKKIIKGCLNGKIQFPFSYRFGKVLNKIYNLFYLLLKQTGREIFFYPASYKILKLINFKPDIIFLSDIHSNFFDIRLITKWSRDFSIFYSLSDLWLFTGHCGIPLDCDKYLIGCGGCPDLALPPLIPKDKTAKNYNFKQRIIKNSIIHFIAPSNWVYQIANKIELNSKSTISLLPNAIDTNKFSPGEKNKSRKQLNLKLDQRIILTSAVGFINNPYKDLKTLLEAYKKIKNKKEQKNIVLIVIGENLNNYPEFNKNDIIFTGIINNNEEIINYYRSADIVVHSSNIETWGYTVSEALSIGVPTIASNVGGIIDQIRGFQYNNNNKLNKYDINNANGILFNRGDIDELYSSLLYLLKNKKKCEQLSKNAREFALENLDISYHLKLFLQICDRLN